VDPLSLYALVPFLSAWTAQGHYLGVDTWLWKFRWLDLHQAKDPDHRSGICASKSVLICHSSAEHLGFHRFCSESISGRRRKGHRDISS
jgi:hypothetical protein